MMVETTPICCWISWNLGLTTRPKRNARYSSSTMEGSASSASGALIRNMATITPPPSATTAASSISPKPTKRSVSPMSPVARLIKSPVWARSWKAKGRCCTAW